MANLGGKLGPLFYNRCYPFPELKDRFFFRKILSAKIRTLSTTRKTFLHDVDLISCYWRFLYQIRTVITCFLFTHTVEKCLLILVFVFQAQVHVHVVSHCVIVKAGQEKNHTSNNVS